jgi:hypothetical protein
MLSSPALRLTSMEEESLSEFDRTPERALSLYVTAL